MRFRGKEGAGRVRWGVLLGHWRNDHVLKSYVQLGHWRNDHMLKSYVQLDVCRTRKEPQGLTDRASRSAP